MLIHRLRKWFITTTPTLDHEHLNGHYTISHTTVQTALLRYQTVGLTVHDRVSTTHILIPLGPYVQLINMAKY